MLHLVIFLIFLPSAKQASTVARQTQTSYSMCKSDKLWSYSFRYYASKLWNLLPDNVRVSTSLAAIKIALKTVQLDNEWCSQWPMLNSQITYTYLYIFYLYYSIFIYLSVYFTYWCTLIQFYRFIFFRDISNSARLEVK